MKPKSYKQPVTFVTSNSIKSQTIKSCTESIQICVSTNCEKSTSFTFYAYIHNEKLQGI